MNIEFLKKLKQKLQVGNTRSIHLNSYPGRLAARLDLFELGNIKNGLHTEFIKKLLSNPSFDFKFRIEPSEVPAPLATPQVNSEQGEPAAEHTANSVPIRTVNNEEQVLKQNLIAKRLSSIYYENEDTYLEHGVKTFGFGYPSLIYRSKQDPDKILCAPVFIWMLELHRDKNDWIISRDEEMGISINDVLLNYLEQDLGTTGFISLNEDYLSDSVIDENEFERLVHILLRQISTTSQTISGGHIITPMYDKQKRAELIKTSGNPVVTYSGIFGLFKIPKEPLIKDIKDLISRAESLQFDKLPAVNYQEIKYSAVETDPAQEHALKSLGSGNKLIIHGPPGTGKSQTLTAIIVNALFNKAKCLVVCEKRTALEVIQKNLAVLGLERFCGLIEDVNRDRKKIVDVVREPRPEIRSVSMGILDNIFKETDELTQSVNSNHIFYSRLLLNDMTWSDLIGKMISEKDDDENYLELHKSAGNCGIDFTSPVLSDIFNRCVNSVKRNRVLFKTAKSELEIFGLLSDTYFKERSSKDVVMEIESWINRAIPLIDNKLGNLKDLHKEYTAALTSHLREHYKKFSEAISEIADIYSKNTVINSALFNGLDKWTNFKLSFFSLFSGKYRQLKKDKKAIIPRFYGLREFSKFGYFDFTVKEISNSLTELHIQLKEIHSVLESWNDNIEGYIANCLNEYSFRNYNKYAYTDESKIIKAYEDSELLLKELNSGALFNTEQKYESESVVYRIEFLEKLKNRLSSIVKDINCIYDYFYWRSDYLRCDVVSKTIIDNLIHLELDDWEKDTTLYFIFNTLIANESGIRLRDDSMFGLITGNMEKIRNYQVNLIKEYWLGRQKVSAEKLEERTGININALYNKSRNSKFQKRNSLRKIIAADFGLFTDHFPVMLVNPSVCSSLFDMQEGLFDIVIFDEASQLRVEDVYSAKLRGRYRVVSGDENQMPPSNYFSSSQILIDNDSLNEDEEELMETVSTKNLADSESLLEFAIRRGYSESFLDIHYRSKHPDLIAFSNAAFYNSRLSPMPAARSYKAMRYFNVYGIYNQAEGINKQEAEKVISLINELVIPEKGNDNPSIGIATFNIFQRNYILDMINVKANSDSSFAQKISILRNKPAEPFFVKNLENIQGDERDIIIISTTFGKRADGSFIQNYGPINQEKGYRLLNVIVTRAKHMMIVCTSIPDEIIAAYPALLASEGNRGKAVFYSYLAYAKSIEDYDPKSTNSVLGHLKLNTEEKQHGIPNTGGGIFEEEVYKSLCLHISEERLLTNYTTGGFKIDIAVLPENKGGKITAIECDGNDNHTSPEAYAWDIFRQKHLESAGLKYIRTWSVNWWNNRDREIRRLIEFIDTTD